MMPISALVLALGTPFCTQSGTSCSGGHAQSAGCNRRDVRARTGLSRCRSPSSGGRRTHRYFASTLRAWTLLHLAYVLALVRAYRIEQHLVRLYKVSRGAGSRARAARVGAGALAPRDARRENKHQVLVGLRHDPRRLHAVRIPVHAQQLLVADCLRRHDTPRTRSSTARGFQRAGCTDVLSC